MTRLTDALARARGEVAGAGGAASKPQAAAVPNTWRFDMSDLSDALSSDHRPDAPPDFQMQSEPEDFPDPVAAANNPFSHLDVLDTLVVGPSPNNALVEQFRHLAAALHHALRVQCTHRASRASSGKSGPTRRPTWRRQSLPQSAVAQHLNRSR